MNGVIAATMSEKAWMDRWTEGRTDGRIAFFPRPFNEKMTGLLREGGDAEHPVCGFLKHSLLTIKRTECNSFAY